MKILIANGYVRENKGDAALISVLAGQLQKAFPDAEIFIASLEDPREHPDFYGFKNVGSLQLYGVTGKTHLARIFHKIFAMIVGSIWPVLPFRNAFLKLLPWGMRGELRALEEADLVVAASGGYLSGDDSLAGNLNVYFISMPLRIAERFRKMTVFAPQSFGPFGNSWQNHHIKKMLNAARLVFVREGKSVAILKEIGVSPDHMFKTVDSGFAHAVRTAPATTGKRSGAPRIGITARNWLKGDAQKRYEAALGEFIAIAEQKYGAKTLLIPQVTSNHNEDDDRIVEGRIKNIAVAKGATPLQVTDEMDHYEIKELYSSCDFTVGTRFHSVIFSLTSYVPAIAVEYEHKTSGIMHDLGLDEWVIKIEDVTAEKLSALFDRLIKEEKSYGDHLRKVLPPYIARTDEVAEQIKKSYYNK